jgi:hypothetical protein
MAEEGRARSISPLSFKNDRFPTLNRFKITSQSTATLSEIYVAAVPVPAPEARPGAGCACDPFAVKGVSTAARKIARPLIYKAEHLSRSRRDPWIVQVLCVMQ